jgi:hypothetical protein
MDVSMGLFAQERLRFQLQRLLHRARAACRWHRVQLPPRRPSDGCDASAGAGTPVCCHVRRPMRADSMACGARTNGSTVHRWAVTRRVSGGGATTSTKEQVHVSGMYHDRGFVGCGRRLWRRRNSRSGRQMARSAALVSQSLPRLNEGICRDGDCRHGGLVMALFAVLFGARRCSPRRPSSVCRGSSRSRSSSVPTART